MPETTTSMAAPFDAEGWHMQCKALAAEANRGTGLVYEIYARQLTAAVNSKISTLPEAYRPAAIDIAKEYGYMTPAEIEEDERVARELGLCCHGLDPDCCPCGCGDYDDGDEESDFEWPSDPGVGEESTDGDTPIRAVP